MHHFLYYCNKVCLKFLLIIFSQLQVNKNGVVSFGNNFSIPNTMEFPILDTPPFIAGFWDNLSLQNENKYSLAFLELNSSSSYFATQQTRFSAYLHEGFGANMMEFDITHIFLATWKKVIQNSSVSEFITCASTPFDCLNVQDYIVVITCPEHILNG